MDENHTCLADWFLDMGSLCTKTNIDSIRKSDLKKPDTINCIPTPKAFPIISQIAKFMGPTWGPPGSCRPQMGPMLATWTLLSGVLMNKAKLKPCSKHCSPFNVMECSEYITQHTPYDFWREPCCLCAIDHTRAKLIRWVLYKAIVFAQHILLEKTSYHRVSWSLKVVSLGIKTRICWQGTWQISETLVNLRLISPGVGNNSAIV